MLITMQIKPPSEQIEKIIVWLLNSNDWEKTFFPSYNFN